MKWPSILAVAFLLVVAGCDRNDELEDRSVNEENPAVDTQSPREPGLTARQPSGSSERARTAAGEEAGATSADANASKASAEFLKKAISGGRMEVELGRVAEQKAEDGRVKAFGQRMVTDHQKANDSLMQTARQLNVDTASGMLSEHQQHVDQISGLTGAEFDRKYVDLMVSAHEKDVQNFEQQAQSGDSQAVRDVAQKILPTLKEHLQMVRALKENLGQPEPDDGESSEEQAQNQP